MTGALWSHTPGASVLFPFRYKLLQRSLSRFPKVTTKVNRIDGEFVVAFSVRSYRTRNPVQSGFFLLLRRYGGLYVIIHIKSWSQCERSLPNGGVICGFRRAYVISKKASRGRFISSRYIGNDGSLLAFDGYYIWCFVHRVRFKMLMMTQT